MPSLNYKIEFANRVEDGHKRQTIRATRKYPVKVGQKLYHYTGLRTKQSRRLGVSTCTSVHDIEICGYALVLIDNHIINSAEAEDLARADGFLCAISMISFFTSEVGTFKGQLIKWENIEF